jgi:arsenate reductase
MNDKPGILFLCTGNSYRSQMAEGLCRELLGDRFRAFSAGIEKHGLNPRAVRVMGEMGIDISGHRSKTVDELEEERFEYVVTVCDSANETCPYFPAEIRVIHRGFSDPPSVTAGMDSEEDILAVYRSVRDEIRSFIESLPGTLGLYG